MLDDANCIPTLLFVSTDVNIKGVKVFDEPLASICNLRCGDVMPIPTLPLELIVTLTEPLVSNCRF